MPLITDVRIVKSERICVFIYIALSSFFNLVLHDSILNILFSVFFAQTEYFSGHLRSIWDLNSLKNNCLYDYTQQVSHSTILMYTENRGTHSQYKKIYFTVTLK